MNDPGATPSDNAEIIERRRRRAARLRRSRAQRRLRLRRHGRRAYIRSVYFLPSLATLGNAICGFGAMYVAAFLDRSFSSAAYLIFLAMVFDALDGRLARFTRHTTDFGGQLDSLADMLSFGAAPAFIALHLFHVEVSNVHPILSRLIWAFGALFMSCAALRLARFNVSNEHGEQHHFSFLGLPSPGAAGTVASMVLLDQELRYEGLFSIEAVLLWVLPLVVLATGLLMISNLRYPHLVNRYLRGKRSFGRLIVVLGIVLLLVVAHQYTLCIGMLAYASWGPLAWVASRLRRRNILMANPIPANLP